MPRSNRSSKMNMKQVDKMVAKMVAKWKRENLVMKRQKAGAAKAKAAGRSISPLQPEPWITSVVTFLIYALPSGGSGKVKKTLLRLLKEYHSPEALNEVEVLLETLDASMMEMNRFKPMMEMVQVETIEPELWIETEPVMLEMIDYSDKLYMPQRQRLTVNLLNEEVRQLKKGVKKVASSDPKDAQVKIFFDLYSKFLEKLKEFQITSPEKIEAFLLDMVGMVKRLRVKRGEAVAAKQKVREPVQENHKSPVGMTLASLMDESNLDACY